MLRSLFSELAAYFFAAAGILNLISTSALLSLIKHRHPAEYSELGSPRVWSNSGSSLFAFWSKIWRRRYPKAEAQFSIKLLCLIVGLLSFLLCILFPVWAAIGVVAANLFDVRFDF